ncbi:ABC transporter permease subunit [Actinophytocola sp.]|uniref:ABC transporter permease subunit n=1 Tax=Actinophytocola sp. TaxID=1872138 RepID=UPI003D6A83A4
MTSTSTSIESPPDGTSAQGRQKVDRRGGRRILGLIAPLTPHAAFYLIMFLVPLAGLIAVSFGRTEGADLIVDGSLRQYVAIFSDPFYLKIVTQTFLLALMVCAVCAVLAFPVALRLTQVRPWVQGLMLVVLVAPLFTDVNLRTLGAQKLLANHGLVNYILTSIGLTDDPITFLGTRTGVVIAMSTEYLPFMVLSIYAVLQTLDGRLVEAAHSLGANRAKSFLTVILPASVPGLVAGCTFVFLLSITSFVTPSIIGSPRVVVISTLIYQKVNVTLDWSFAAAAGVTLLVIVMVLTLLFGRAGNAQAARSMKGAAVTPSRRRGPNPLTRATRRLMFSIPDLRMPRFVGTVVVVLVFVFILAPIAVVVLAAFTPNQDVGFPPSSLTTTQFADAFEFDQYWSAFTTSVVVAVFATILSVILGLIAALALFRRKGRGRETATAFLMAPLLVPQIVVSLALLRYTRELDLPTGTTLLIASHMLITVPYCTRTIVSGLYALDWSLIEASSSLGARPLRTLRRVVLPMLRPTLMVAGLYAAIMSFINVAISLFISTPQANPLPVFMYSQLASGYAPNTMAAFGLLVVGAAAVVTLLFHKLVGLDKFSVR